jgi:hypothetical protein
MEHEFFIVRFSHKGRNGFFTPQENVVHIHSNGYHNTRCKLVGNQFYCPICNEYFDQQMVYASAKDRGVGKDRSHWIETKVIGQHKEKVIYSHDHADKGVKAADTGSTNLSATCLSCSCILDLFSWRETNTKNKNQLFAAVFVEQEKMSIWAEISEFRAENIDIWLEDKTGQAFYLSTEDKLLPAEKEDEMIFCGGKTWKGNDDRKSLLFLVDEELTQELINRQLLKEEDQGFHLVMPEEMKSENEESIPQKPGRGDRSTKEFTSGDLLAVKGNQENPQTGEETKTDFDTGLIPRATEEDLSSSTPIPENNLPLLEMADEPIITINHQETVLSGSSETKAEETNEEEAEAPKIVQIMPPPEELLTGVKPLTDTLNEGSGEAESYDPLMAEAEMNLDLAEKQLAESLEKAKVLLDGQSLPPATIVAEATDAAPTMDPAEAIAQEPTMELGIAPTTLLPVYTEEAPATDEAPAPETEDAPTPATDEVPTSETEEAPAPSTEKAPAPATEEAPTPAQDEDEEEDGDDEEEEDDDDEEIVQTRHCVVCGKLLTISPISGKGLCPEHEKRCHICDTVTSKEARFCGGCGSPFSQVPQDKFWNQVLLGMAGIGVIILLAGLFAGMIHQFKSQDLRKQLAENRRTQEAWQQGELIMSQKLNDQKQALTALEERQTRISKQVDSTELKADSLWTRLNDLQVKQAEQEAQRQTALAKLDDKIRQANDLWQKHIMEESQKSRAENEQKSREKTPQPLQLGTETEPVMVAVDFSKDLITITIKGLAKLNYLKTAPAKPQVLSLENKEKTAKNGKKQASKTNGKPGLPSKTPVAKPEQESLKVFIWRGPS